jgi:hypothetical protein
MKKSLVIKYEVWSSDNNCQLSCGRADIVKTGIFKKDAKLIHTFYAATYEEAMSIYHLRLGFEPYKPSGKPKLCPNDCGSFYYPDGSSQCPYCGEV